MDRYKLEYEIKKNGLTLGAVCETLGISRSAFYRKIRGQSGFTQSEIAKLIEILKLDDPASIFFNQLVS